MRLLYLIFIITRYVVATLMFFGFIKLSVVILEKLALYLDKKITSMVMLKDEVIRNCKNFNRKYNKFLYSNPSIVEIKDRNNSVYQDTDWDKIVSLRNIKFPIKTAKKEFYKNQIRVYFNYLVDDGLVLIHKEYLCNKEFYKKRF